MKPIIFKISALQKIFQDRFILPSLTEEEKEKWNNKDLVFAGRNLIFDSLSVDDIEIQVLDFMFENGLIKIEEVEALNSNRLIFDVKALKYIDPENIKILQKLLQKDGTYPEGEKWVDGDVINGNKTINAALSTFNTNIASYVDLIKESKNEINHNNRRGTEPKIPRGLF